MVTIIIKIIIKISRLDFVQPSFGVFLKIMESSKKMMPVLTVSLVAMIIGVITQQVEWPCLLPQTGSQIFSSPITGDGPWWSFPPVLFVVGAIHGALLAALGWRRLCNRLGMAFFDSVLIIGLFAVSIPVRSTELMVVGRLLLGTGSGGMSAIVPAYVGEISHPKFRGRLGALFPVIMVMGVMISYVFGPFKQYDYQQPFNISFNVFCCSIIILHAIGLYFIHKSLLSSSNNFFEQHHHNDDSLSAINLLGQPNWMEVLFPPPVRCIDNCCNPFRRSSWHGLDVLNYRADFRAVFVGVGCMFFHQMCGINVIESYMVHTMKMADIHIDPKTVFITLGIVQVIVMCVTIIIIDSKGRRILLISSAVIMCFCFAGLAFCNIIKMQLNATTLNNISMICIMFFILAYSLGFGPVPWVIVGEIFSMKVKPYGVSFATAINWLMMLAGAYFPYEINKFFEIEYVFLVYFVLCLFGALFAWRFIPETKKFSLTQIQLEIDASFEVISYIPV